MRDDLFAHQVVLQQGEEPMAASRLEEVGVVGAPVVQQVQREALVLGEEHVQAGRGGEKAVHLGANQTLHVAQATGTTW